MAKGAHLPAPPSRAVLSQSEDARGQRERLDRATASAIRRKTDTGSSPSLTGHAGPGEKAEHNPHTQGSVCRAHARVLVCAHICTGRPVYTLR